MNQSLVCADCVIISHFVIYKWHEDDLSSFSDSATAGTVLDELPFSFRVVPAPFLFPCKILHSVAEGRGRLSPQAVYDVFQCSTPVTKLQLFVLEAKNASTKS